MRARFRRQSPWVWATALITGLIALPLLFVLSRLVEGGTSGLFGAVFGPTTRGYLWNTLRLFLGVGVLCFVWGVGTAWLVTQYEFPGRRGLSGALILPLVIPTYILAYAYAGALDVTGPIEGLLRGWWGAPVGRARRVPFEIMSLWGLTLLLALNLYPYVLMTCRAAFARQSVGVWEVAKSLGVGPWRTFFTVILPMTRPAWVGGLTLCMLEVVNDYGAAEYYGVDTFATAIFRAWFGRDDAPLAIRMAALLMLLVLVLLGLERWQRGEARYHEGKSVRPMLRQPLHGGWAWMATLFCVVPFFFGFVLPVLQLGLWTWQTGSKHLNAGFGRLLMNSVWVAGSVAFCAVGVALLIAYTVRVFEGPWVQRMARLALVGYSIPGTVIAVGVMVVAAQVDRLLMDWRWTHQTILGGSFGLLLAAFVVRFLMVAYSPIETGFQKNGRNLNEAARLLGHPPWRTLWLVELPLMKSALLAAFLLVFIDALKELPLTLFLRWGNFQTLSTEIYNYAKQMEVAEEAGLYALFLVSVGMIPVFVLEKLLGHQGER
jgi:iron(III) transport system permease protein